MTTTSRRSGVALTLVALLSLAPALTACSGAPTTTAASATARTGATARRMGVDESPGAVKTSPLDVQSESSWGPLRVHAEWPTIKGATAFDQGLATEVKNRIAAFRADSPSGTGAAMPELTTTWSLVADHDGVVGARLSTEDFAGASTGHESVTVYGTRDGQQVWRGPDLLTSGSDAKLLDLAVRSASAAGLRRADDPERPEAAELLRDVAFTRDGGLQLVVSSGVLGANSDGRVLVTLDRGTTDGLLSEPGRQVRDAVLLSTPAPAHAHPTGGATTAHDDPAPDDESSTSAAESTTPETTTPGATDGTTATDGAAADGATGDAAAPGARVDCATVKCIALTFDDGPGPLTPGILDTLEAHKARATFFTLGPAVESAPATMRRMASLGMAIGDHTWTHRQFTRLSDDAVIEEISRTADAIKTASGVAPVAVRPPYGAYSKSTPHGGLPFVLWDVDTEDWKNRDPQITTQRALSGAHRGAIVLMHDIHPSTAKALPGIVEGLQKQGYTLVTIPELLGKMDPAKAYFSAPQGR